MNQTLKVASWNVNSIRARLHHVENFLHTAAPHVLCLQETKVADANFPKQVFEDAGYHVAFCGQPAYNGVAIVSRYPLENVQHGFVDDADGFFDSQKRLIAATVKGVRIYNVYAPNGDNPASDKFFYKEKWYAHLKNMFDVLHHTQHDNVLLCGDLNIAPQPIDVADPQGMLGKCGFHPLEHIWLASTMSWGFVDVFRSLHPTREGAFSWWDYRQNSFLRNRGMRIDNILVSKKLADCCLEADIDLAPRSFEKPSDHTPVFATFKVPDEADINNL